MTCRADGNPPPRYQWLQKLPTHEIILRGEGPQLIIDNVTYDQQGEYVCKAINEIRGQCYKTFYGRNLQIFVIS